MQKVSRHTVHRMALDNASRWLAAVSELGCQLTNLCSSTSICPTDVLVQVPSSFLIERRNVP